MKGVLILAVIVFALAFGVSAQQSPKPADDSQAKSVDQQRKEIDPQLRPTDEPPRYEPRTAQDSSSKDRSVDISPPPGDDQHEGSPLLGPEPDSGVSEMKPWNPHKADKDVEVGIFYFKQKNYRAAESRFRGALHWQDNHAEATYRLAEVLEKTGRPDQAKKYYERYLQILPEGNFAKDSKKALERLAKEESKKSQAKASISQP